MGPHIPYTNPNQHEQDWIDDDQCQCVTCEWTSSSCCRSCALSDWMMHIETPVPVSQRVSRFP